MSVIIIFIELFFTVFEASFLALAVYSQQYIWISFRAVSSPSPWGSSTFVLSPQTADPRGQEELQYCLLPHGAGEFPSNSLVGWLDEGWRHMTLTLLTAVSSPDGRGGCVSMRNDDMKY